MSREQIARAAYEGVVCGLLDGLDALRAAGVAVDAGRLILIGGGARSEAYRQVVAQLAQREVVVPDADELVVLGAALQAAARHHGRPVAEVHAAWGLDAGATITPTGSADAAAETRARYASVRRE